MQRLLLDTEEEDRLESERPKLYHTLKMKQRRSQRTIHYLRNENGQMQTRPRRIAFTMTSHFRKIIEDDNDSVQKLMDETLQTRSNQYGGALETPFEKEDIYKAIRAGGRGKAPGEDGLGKEFYERNWTLMQDDLCDVLNQMFWDGKITSRQKHGILICLPKPRGNPTPADYRPITLLNSDYKILARMVARRLRPSWKITLHIRSTVGSVGIQSSMLWRLCLIPSHTLKVKTSLYVCSLWTSKTHSTGYRTAICLEYSTDMESVPHSSTAFGTCTKDPHRPYKSMAIGTDQFPSDVQSARDLP